MSLVIRRATTDDIPALVEILSDAVDYKTSLGDNAWGDQPYTADEIRPAIDRRETYIALFDDQAVGTFKLQWIDDIVWESAKSNAGYIHQLAIKNGFHGQSLGKQLLDWAAQEAKRHGKQLLRLDCSDQNANLCHYYERQGFKQVGSKSIPAYDNYTAALYERQL